MTKSKTPKPLVRQRAEEAVEKLVEEHDEDVLGVIRQLLAERVKKPLGRRAEPNWPIYLEMARSLKSGKAQHVKGAARKVAHRIKGVSEDTAVERLRKGYPKYRVELEAELAAEAASAGEDREVDDLKASIFERAFKEDVDTWDL